MGDERAEEEKRWAPGLMLCSLPHRDVLEGRKDRWGGQQESRGFQQGFLSTTGVPGNRRCLFFSGRVVGA